VGAIGVAKTGLAHLAAPHDEATMSRTRCRLAMHRRLRRWSFPYLLTIAQNREHTGWVLRSSLLWGNGTVGTKRSLVTIYRTPRAVTSGLTRIERLTMSAKTQKNWRELCRDLHNEQESGNLIGIVRELNGTLEQLVVEMKPSKDFSATPPESDLLVQSPRSPQPTR
jgi:hypothetical protein